MDRNVRIIFYNCYNRGMASITLIATLVFSFFIQNALWADSEDIAKEILEIQDTDILKDRFDHIGQLIGESEDPIAESRKFIEAFLDQIRSKFGIRLSVSEACQLIKENFASLNLPPETQEALLMAIDILSPEKPITINRTAESKGFGKLIQNGWDCLRGKKPLHKGTCKIKITPNKISTAKNIAPKDELPGNVYVGGMEMFAGALLCIIPHPWVVGVGLFMIGDGVRRVVDGNIQAADEKRLNVDYTF